MDALKGSKTKKIVGNSDILKIKKRMVKLSKREKNFKPTKKFVFLKVLMIII
jgi:hypothetical protein